MPKGKKKKVEEVKVSSKPSPEPRPEAKPMSEKDQMLNRQSELMDIHNWLTVNAIQDIGQLEVKLSQVNHRLTEL